MLETDEKSHYRSRIVSPLNTMVVWRYWRFRWYLMFCFILVIKCENSGLERNLRHYEVIRSADVGHRVVKRSGDHSHESNSLKEMQFQALGREFRLMLTPRKGILSNQFRAFSLDADGNKVPVSVERDTFYEGSVVGETKSDVSMHYEDGLMTATIRTPKETYVVEPAWRHLDDNGSDAMIAYRTSDVNYSWDHKDFIKQNYKVCGYVREGPSSHGDSDNNEERHSRLKRQQNDVVNFDQSKSRCPLLLVADYRFYQNMGARSEKSTINYLVSLLDRVHKIYMETFWRDGVQQTGFKDMGFVIEEINVHKDPSPVANDELHYNMDKADWNVRDLLEVFSREKSHQSFCLAHLFTDIKFDGGILGLAYVGSSRRNSVGGICSPEYFKNGHILYLNSGLSSSRNHYGQRVITREADLVTAHEFGHNWGSEHDPDTQECSPNTRDGGSYLMYTFSVRGSDRNNKCFSPCSLRSIQAVLKSKSSKCFKEPQESFCGNSRVETGEECDVGLLDGEDACCERNCTLKRTDTFWARCSDKNSPCCRGCQYMPYGNKCREANPNTCEKESVCDSADCPPSPAEDDDKECIDKGRCYGGECRPFCATIGKISCMCDIPADSCKRCCRLNYNTSCLAVEPVEILLDGTPCIHGLCHAGICEKNMQLDIVERFWDIIEDINMNTLLKFLNDNIVGTVIVVSLIIWIPASCFISYIDRKRMKEALQWRRPGLGSLSNVGEPKKIIRVSTRRSNSVTTQKDTSAQWPSGPRMRLHEAGPSVSAS